MRKSLIKKKTLFVVGAGASCEFGFPSGYQLKAAIAEKLDIRFTDFQTNISSGDRQLASSIIGYSRANQLDPNQLLKGAWKIRDAMPISASIDVFLDAHSNDEAIQFCGKLAIVKCILEAEKASGIAYEHEGLQQKISADAFGDRWLAKFATKAFSNVSIQNIGQVFQNVSFVVFNYDRCIEHGLLHLLMTYFAIEWKKASELMNTLRVFHPYGTVGKLQWQLPLDSQTIDVEYGEESAPLFDISKQIKTFTEQIENQETLKSIRLAYAEADQIVFLGFGFHEQNMLLLTSDKECAADKYISTTLGFSTADTAIIVSDIEKSLGKYVNGHIKPVRCTDLFDEYSRIIGQ